MAAPARKPQSAAPTPAEILDLIAAAKAKRSILERRQAEEADQSISSGDDSKYNAVVAEMAALHQEIDRLQSAMVGATNRNKEAREVEQRAAAAAVREHVSKLLDQRLAIVARIEAATGDLARAWKELVEQSDKALVALPNVPTGGMLLTNAELIMAMSAELFRQTAVPAITGRPMPMRMTPSLPAPKCPNFLWLNQPEQIPKLSTAVTEANNLAKSVMEKKNVAAA
jgi:hypothetical protein